MSLLEASLNSLLHNLNHLLKDLNHLLKDDVTLPARMKENVSTLRKELMTLEVLIKFLIKELSDTHHSNAVEILVKEIRSLISDAEDAIDSYILHAADIKSRSFLLRYLIRMIWMLQDRRQIASIAQKVGKYNLQNRVDRVVRLQHLPSVDDVNQEPRFRPVVEEDPIGFEKPAEELVELLIRGPEHFEVISISGMAGLGKTTLARKVFKDLDVDYEFMIRAFVYVSQEYRKRDVLQQILRSFTYCDDKVVDERELEKLVCKELSGKQYLVVLDDVWEPKDWDRFKAAFPRNNKRCRVLITTRNVKVAEHANPTNPNSLCRLNLLPLQDSRRLLRYKVFHSDDYCGRPELQRYEVEIAMKCDGLPLALVVIAGTLMNSPHSVDWWRHVANNLKDYLTTDRAQTAQVMGLIYSHLPDRLKPCFIYLGVFPEQFEIPVWNLVRLWISEGFIQEEEEGDRDLEGIAEVFLGELIHRNLVMVGKMRSNGKIKTCLLNTSIHAFCVRQASDEKLFKEMRKDEFKHSLSLDHDRHRRLTINNADVVKDFFTGNPSGDHIRSFLTFTREIQVGPAYVSCIARTFKLLKVLQAESLFFSGFSPQISRLVLLKYVAISSNISSLPSAFSALCYLQTLIVKTTSSTLQIKADIWNMPQFRHLHANVPTSFPSRSSKREESSQNVRTLSIISAECCKKEVFDRTPKLKKLAIGGDLSELFESTDGSTSTSLDFRALKWLENLKLLNHDGNSVLRFRDSKEIFPPGLAKLTLMNTRLKWEDMSKLGALRELEVLKLKQFAFCGDTWNTEKGCFPSLKHLHIEATDLVEWNVSGDHFPELKSLKLYHCDKLQPLPHDFADIPNLKQVVLHYTNSWVAARARRLQEWMLNKANGRRIFSLSVYPPEH